MAGDVGYKKGKIRPLSVNAQRKAAVTTFLRRFKGAKVEGVRQIGKQWRVRGKLRGRDVRIMLRYQDLVRDIKGRRAEKGYPKRSRKGSRKPKRMAKRSHRFWNEAMTREHGVGVDEYGYFKNKVGQAARRAAGL